jgi:hypothetical protein
MYEAITLLQLTLLPLCMWDLHKEEAKPRPEHLHRIAGNK